MPSTPEEVFASAEASAARAVGSAAAIAAGGMGADVRTGAVSAGAATGASGAAGVLKPVEALCCKSFAKAGEPNMLATSAARAVGSAAAIAAGGTGAAVATAAEIAVAATWGSLPVGVPEPVEAPCFKAFAKAGKPNKNTAR